MILVQKGYVKLCVVFLSFLMFLVEISSDGGPELSAKVTKYCLKRWGIHHRVSSSNHPMSNGRQN